ncbi:hypothetical protein IW150_001532 [Coemansia sp. RSA 2607]|nr:hypothetical protein IW150_001532 [Coemansia sp. RSA 2607]
MAKRRRSHRNNSSVPTPPVDENTDLRNNSVVDSGPEAQPEASGSNPTAVVTDPSELLNDINVRPGNASSVSQRANTSTTPNFDPELLLGQQIEIDDEARDLIWAFALTDGMELQVIQMILQMPEHTRQPLWQQTRQLAQQQVQGWNPELAQRWEPELTQMIEQVEQRNQQQLFEQSQQSSQEQEQEQIEILEQEQEQVHEEIEIAEQEQEQIEITEQEQEQIEITEQVQEEIELTEQVQEEIEITEQIQEQIEITEQPPVELSVQEPAQVQQTARQALQESAQQLTPEPEHVQEEDLAQSPASDSENGDLYSKHFDAEQHPLNNASETDTNDLPDDNELFSACRQYNLVDITKERFSSLEYTPRCALVHQFRGMDRETVIAYGGDKLQLWDPVSKNIVKEWDGGLQNVHIGQVEPISPSMLAVVSSGTGENEQVSKAGRLMFTDLNWSTENNQFSDMTVRQWVDDEPPVEDISVVECAQSQDAENELQVSLFTGSRTDGAVYRRKFDFSEGEAEMIQQQSMVNNHDGDISALCHVEAQKCVISSTSFGNICINDHESGSRVHSFSIALHGTISSITRCPFNPFLFLIGCCQREIEFMIFDMRANMNGVPELSLKDAGSTITAPSNKPKWDTETGLILAPVRRNVDGKAIATINMWDPRCIKNNNANHFRLPENETEAFSVEFTKPTDIKQRIMVTASEKAIGFFSSRRVNF